MNLRHILLLTVVILTASDLYSQRPPNKSYDCYDIELGTSGESHSPSIPYSSIIVADERPDTMKAGYYYSGLKDKGAQRVCFDKGLQYQVNSFYNARIQRNTGTANSILACVKKLWFGTYDTTDIKENKLPIRTRKLFLKIEFYENDRSCYYPLYRFDTTINMNEMPGKSPAFVLETALNASVRKMINNNINRQHTRCLSRHQIDSFNNTANTYPIQKEKVAKKGVYMSYIEFRNNEPAYTAFNVRYSKTGDVVTIPSADRDSVINAWAISDGKKMYVRLGSNLFELFKSGDCYDFYGYDIYFQERRPNMYTTPIVVLPLMAITAKGTPRKPFQVDIETGEIY
jgi:hypothetical protein